MKRVALTNTTRSLHGPILCLAIAIPTPGGLLGRLTSGFDRRHAT